MSTISASVAADNLRARRRRLGISQQRLANKAHCSVSMLRLLEGGYQPSRSPTRDRIERVLADMERPLPSERVTAH